MENREERENARVLIVEDAAEQARRISAALCEAGYQVDIASESALAFEKMAAERPDLVATDLVVPGHEGVDLVIELRQKYPQVPVIVVTAEGQAEVAAEALRHGAASYVPESRIGQELVRTVDTVLEVALEERSRNRVLRQMKAFHLIFELENDRKLVGPLVRFLQEAVSAVEPAATETELTHLGMALQEALVNAIVHGNLEVSSETRRAGGGGPTWNQLIAQRLGDPRYADRRVHLDFRLEEAEVTCEIEDEGPGFDLSQVPDPTDPGNLLKVSGRGLFLIEAFTDQVTHNAAGNRITLYKKLGAEARAAATG